MRSHLTSRALLRVGARLSLCALALASLSGCAASKYYGAAQEMRSKSRTGALEYLALCLEADPANQEAITMIDEIGKEIASEHAQTIKGLERAKKYDQAVAQCDRVIALRQWVKGLPGKIDIYHDQAERARLAQAAAEKFYDEGQKLEAQDNAKKASVAYRRALGFVPAFKDAEERYQRNRSAAMVRLCVYPFNCSDGVGFLADSVRADLAAKIVDLKPEFLEVVDDPSSAAHYLEGQVQAQFSDTGWRAQKESNTIYKERVIGQREVVDPQTGAVSYEDEVETYEVTATWMVYTRRTEAGLTLSYTIKSNKGAGVASGRATTDKASDETQYVANFAGAPDGEWEEAIPNSVHEMPTAPQDPAGIEELAGRISVQAALTDFAQKIFEKYK